MDGWPSISSSKRKGTGPWEQRAGDPEAQIGAPGTSPHAGRPPPRTVCIPYPWARNSACGNVDGRRGPSCRPEPADAGEAGAGMGAAPSRQLSCPRQPLNVSVSPDEKSRSPTPWSSSKGSGTRLSAPPSPALWTPTGQGHGRETAALLLLPREVRLQLLRFGDREGGAFSPPEMKAQNIPDARAEGSEPKTLQQSPLKAPMDSPATCAQVGGREHTESSS